MRELGIAIVATACAYFPVARSARARHRVCGRTRHFGARCLFLQGRMKRGVVLCASMVGVPLLCWHVDWLHYGVWVHSACARKPR